MNEPLTLTRSSSDGVSVKRGARAVPGSQRELAQQGVQIGTNIIIHASVLRARDGSRSAKQKLQPALYELAGRMPALPAQTANE